MKVLKSYQSISLTSWSRTYSYHTIWTLYEYHMPSKSEMNLDSGRDKEAHVEHLTAIRLWKLVERKEHLVPVMQLEASHRLPSKPLHVFLTRIGVLPLE